MFSFSLFSLKGPLFSFLQVDIRHREFYHVSACSQGGVQFPTGGIPASSRRARERLSVAVFFRFGKGQPIWYKARADGNSPDERG